MIQFDHYFSNGWNHQPVLDFFLFPLVLPWFEEGVDAFHGERIFACLFSRRMSRWSQISFMLKLNPLGEDEPNLDEYFFHSGVVPPPTSVHATFQEVFVLFFCLVFPDVRFVWFASWGFSPLGINSFIIWKPVRTDRVGWRGVAGDWSICKNTPLEVEQLAPLKIGKGSSLNHHEFQGLLLLKFKGVFIEIKLTWILWSRLITHNDNKDST